jgi:hypothetical protein
MAGYCNGDHENGIPRLVTWAPEDLRGEKLHVLLQISTAKRGTTFQPSLSFALGSCPLRLRGRRSLGPRHMLMFARPILFLVVCHDVTAVFAGSCTCGKVVFGSILSD